MQRTKQILLSLALLCASFSTSARAQDAAKANETFLAAMGPYEDMVGPALAKNDKAIAKLLPAAERQAEAVRKTLPSDAAQQFDRLLQTIQKAVERKDQGALGAGRRPRTVRCKFRSKHF